jgi:hypothetical protein
MPNFCYMCRFDQESTQHLFGSCGYNLQIRQYIIDALLQTTTPCQLYITTKYDQLLLRDDQKIQWRQLEIITSFILWRERCQ